MQRAKAHLVLLQESTQKGHKCTSCVAGAGAGADGTKSTSSTAALRQRNTVGSIAGTPVVALVPPRSQTPAPAANAPIYDSREAALDASAATLTLERECHGPNPIDIQRLINIYASGQRSLPSNIQNMNDLKRVITSALEGGNSRLNWLTVPLVQGLLDMPSRFRLWRSVLQHPIAGPAPLHFICQWKQLEKMFGWKGRDELVALVVQAGAPVNAVASNQCTPMFLAVKYGTMETVRLLIEAGVNLHLKDCNCKYCLWNAFERPNPAIVNILLEHLPADGNNDVSEGFGKGQFRSIPVTYLDQMLSVFIGCGVQVDSSTGRSFNRSVSWGLLGLPNIDVYATTMQRLLQRGAFFTQVDEATNRLSTANPMNILSADFRNHKHVPLDLRDHAKHVAAMLVGQWLPQRLKHELVEDLVTMS